MKWGGPINEVEIKTCLKEIARDTTPGSDGQPPEFYQTFYLLTSHLNQPYAVALHHCTLLATAREDPTRVPTKTILWNIRCNFLETTMLKMGYAILNKGHPAQ